MTTPKPHPLPAALDALRAAESAPTNPPESVGVCRSCGRKVYMGGAFLHPTGWYCATEGCVFPALAR